jgi:hypothetical protein
MGVLGVASAFKLVIDTLLPDHDCLLRLTKKTVNPWVNQCDIMVHLHPAETSFPNVGSGLVHVGHDFVALWLPYRYAQCPILYTFLSIQDPVSYIICI